MKFTLIHSVDILYQEYFLILLGVGHYDLYDSVPPPNFTILKSILV